MTNPKEQTTLPQDQENDIVDIEVKEMTIVPMQTSDQFLPALSVEQAVERYQQMKLFVGSCLDEGIDYGQIQGTKKKTLYKAGAEKLTTFFGLRVTFVDDGSIENFDMDDPFFYYRRKCQLWKGNMLIAEASGSANSRESRYAWRWVKKEEIPSGMLSSELKTRGGKEGMFRWQYEQRQTSGKYGKPESFWRILDELLAHGEVKEYQKEQHWDGQEKPYIEWESIEYRIPNDDIFTLVNTILKMAEKRALVAATLIGCNASDYFTQDMEDIQDVTGISVDDGTASKATPPPAQSSIPSHAMTPNVMISNVRDAIKEGTLTGNDFLSLGEKLDFDKTYVMEVLQSFRTKDGEGKVTTNFNGAAEKLIAEYEKVNG